MFAATKSLGLRKFRNLPEYDIMGLYVNDCLSGMFFVVCFDTAQPVHLCCLMLRSYEPRSEKTGLQGLRPGLTQTRLYSHRR